MKTPIILLCSSSEELKNIEQIMSLLWVQEKDWSIREKAVMDIAFDLGCVYAGWIEVHADETFTIGSDTGLDEPSEVSCNFPSHFDKKRAAELTARFIEEFSN